MDRLIPLVMIAVALLAAIAFGAEPITVQHGDAGSSTARIKAIGKDTLDLQASAENGGSVRQVKVDAKTHIVLPNGRPGRLTGPRVGQCWRKPI